MFAYAKTKTQISFAVTAKLISAFVFAKQIVQSLYFLHTKFQVSNHLLWLYSPVNGGPGRKPRRLVFSQRGSYEPYHDVYVKCEQGTEQAYIFAVYDQQSRYVLHVYTLSKMCMSLAPIFEISSPLPCLSRLV